MNELLFKWYKNQLEEVEELRVRPMSWVKFSSESDTKWKQILNRISTTLECEQAAEQEFFFGTTMSRILT